MTANNSKYYHGYLNKLAKLATLATKAELKPEQRKIIKLQTFDSSYFCSKSYFEDNRTQNYFVFQHGNQ